MKLLLMGISASKGSAKGKVRLLSSEREIVQVKKGEVIVLKTMSPVFTLAMINASAVIANTGGKLCHAAIVARERGLPCIVNVESAFKILKNGQEVLVDVTEGKIYG